MYSMQKYHFSNFIHTAVFRSYYDTLPTICYNRDEARAEHVIILDEIAISVCAHSNVYVNRLLPKRK